MAAINPGLYAALRQYFGVIIISNEGIAFPMEQMVMRKDILTGLPRIEVPTFGEYYRVCCPYCNDTRHRLFVNHMYGRKDKFGNDMRFLVTCYNETACMSDPINRIDFYEKVFGFAGDPDSLPLKKASKQIKHVAIELPPYSYNLSDLPEEHPARLYLRSRFFDPDYLSRVYDVRYCGISSNYGARNRIIIPVYQEGKLKGWQGRYLGDLDWKKRGRKLAPKYFNARGMSRRSLVYNLDRAKEYSTVIIVEGPTDVWSVGNMAVATFGASLSDLQLRKITSSCKAKAAVLLYDPDTEGTTKLDKAVLQLSRAYPGRFLRAKLPEGYDPGSLDRSILLPMLKDQAKNAGIKLSFRKLERKVSS